MQQINTNTVRALTTAVLQMEGFEYLSDKFKRIMDIVNEQVSAAVVTDLANFNVLTHMAIHGRTI